MTKNNKILVTLVVLAVVAGGGYMLYAQTHKAPELPGQNTVGNTPTPTPNPTSQNPSPTPTPASTTGTPSLALSPSTQTVSVGGKFDVQLMLDTAGASIDGVDIYQLHFDPTLLKLTDTPGTLMPITAYNKVGTGTLGFSQITAGGTKYNGSGTLLTLHFTALKAGTANVTVDFDPNVLNKSNIAFAGKNLLKQVVNGKYTIQ